MNFYHATAPENLESILRNGFRLPFFVDEDGNRLKVEGCTGHGVYVSKDWRTALWFNRALLRVQLINATRILDVSVAPDMRVIDSLRREFGRELLSDKTLFHKVIPRNKHLKCSELIELTKYHYHRTWGQGPGKRFHGKSLLQCWSMLRRYRYDGFGHSTSDIGIVLLAPEKITVKELVAVIPPRPAGQLDKEFESIEELRREFLKNGERRWRRLAGQIRAAES
jgi:hypothetical protein